MPLCPDEPNHKTACLRLFREKGYEMAVDMGRVVYTHNGVEGTRTQKVELYRYLTNEQLVKEKMMFEEASMSFPPKLTVAQNGLGVTPQVLSQFSI